MAFNRFPLTHINNLDFNGYEEIDDISQQKLFLKSPEIILDISKEEYYKIEENNDKINCNSSQIVFVPTGPKEGWGKPLVIYSSEITTFQLVQKMNLVQNIHHVSPNQSIVDRIGLHMGLPSYNIKLYNN